MTVAGDILRATADIVDGARDKVHGNKEKSFRTIASLWSTYLFNRCTDEEWGFQGVNGEDVAIMQALLKIGRICHGRPVRDHYMDAAGYMAIAGELANTEETKNEEAFSDDDDCCPSCVYWNEQERGSRS